MCSSVKKILVWAYFYFAQIIIGRVLRLRQNTHWQYYFGVFWKRGYSWLRFTAYRYQCGCLPGTDLTTQSNAHTIARKGNGKIVLHILYLNVFPRFLEVAGKCYHKIKILDLLEVCRK